MRYAVMAPYFIAGAMALAVFPAGAQPRHEAHGRGWHGDIRHFHERDIARWRAGHWYRGGHAGRVGWWWVVGGVYYFYPQPVYPYPDPYTPPVIVAPPPAVVVAPRPATPPSAPAATPAPSGTWYYCDAAQGYYPYVPECPGGWRPVPAAPPDAPPR